MGRKYRIQRCGFADIAFDQLPPPNKLAMTEQQAIEYDALVSGSGERLGTITPQ